MTPERRGIPRRATSATGNPIATTVARRTVVGRGPAVVGALPGAREPLIPW